MNMTQASTSARSAVIALTLVGACSDDPTRPPGAAAMPEASNTLALTAESRGQLDGALAFVRMQSVRGLDARGAADDVASAFELIAARIDADDRTGAERALERARAAVDRYRKLTAGDGGAAAADLEAITMTLDRATALIRERVDTQTETTKTSSTER